MSTFVLVHGAWQGGWCWQRVLPVLTAAGQAVYAPTLTGLGERSHLLTRDVDLHTHIRDIVNVLVYEDLWEVVLVGHGYAGMVITGVAECIPERLKHLIYLDAFVPQSGQSIRQMMSVEQLQHEADLVARQGDGWRMLPPSPLYFGVTDPRDGRWMAKRLTSQPFACTTGSVQIGRPAAAVLHKTYIHCTQGDGAFQPFADQARSNVHWRVCDLPTSHSPMISAPEILANAFLQHDPYSREPAAGNCLGGCGGGIVTTGVASS